MFWATANGRVIDLPITPYARILEYKAAQWPFCRVGEAASFALAGRYSPDLEPLC